MAEQQHPVTHGELVEIVRRLDDRISTLDTRMDERISSLETRMVEQFTNVNQNLSEMRLDIRMLTRAMIGFYAFIVASVGVAFTLYKLFPNP